MAEWLTQTWHWFSAKVLSSVLIVARIVNCRNAKQMIHNFHVIETCFTEKIKRLAPRSPEANKEKEDE